MRHLAVGLFGALGALCRYAVDRGLSAHLVGSFPVSTLLINLTGCLLLGFVTGYGAERRRLPEPWRQPLTVGFIGSYTTFSTWSVETVLLLESGRVVLALLYVALSLAGGLGSIGLGDLLAHRADGRGRLG